MNTVLKIAADWCKPCQMLKPIFEKLKDDYKGKINFIEVYDDTDKELYEKYYSKFNLYGIPVVVIMDSNENELERIVGLNKEETYCQMIEKNI
jgi:thiol-disulfide isomerase/thioredoxin